MTATVNGVTINDVRVRTRSRERSVVAGVREPPAPPRPAPEPPRVQGLDGTLHVRRARYRFGEEIPGTAVESEEKVRVQLFGTAPAHVRVGGAVTRNMGNYNSVKVEVSVTLPCYPEESEIDRAYTFASETVDRFIIRELDLATAQGAEDERPANPA